MAFFLQRKTNYKSSTRKEHQIYFDEFQRVITGYFYFSFKNCTSALGFDFYIEHAYCLSISCR